MTKSKQALWVTGALVFAILLGLLIQSVAEGDVWLPPAKYGSQYTLYFGVYDSNSPWRNYETAPAAADIHVFQDGASEARASNAVTDIGRTFKLVLTASEMTARVVTVDINDANGPPLFGDETWYIPTYGNASAYVVGNFDNMDVAMSDVNTIVTNIYDYTTDVNETYIENIYDKNTTIENYVTEVNDILNEFYAYVTDVNETYIENTYDQSQTTYSYLTDVNETYIENTYDQSQTTYSYLTDVNETYITNINNDVTDIIAGDLELIIDPNELMDAVITGHTSTPETLGWLWHRTFTNLP